MKKTSLLLVAFAISMATYAQGLIKVFEADTTFQGVANISISGDFCKVECIKGESVSVKAALEADKTLEGYGISMDQQGSNLTIVVNKPASGWTSHSGFITLTIPDGTNISTETTSGYVTAKDFGTLNLKADTKSGKVEVANFSGEVDVKTASADITISAIKGNVSTYSKNGAQTITNIAGNAKIVSYSGALTVSDIKGVCATETTDGSQTMKNIDGEIKFKTNSGTLKLSDSNGTISGFSNSGTLNLFNTVGVFDLEMTKGSVIGNRVKFTANSSIRTTEGKIKLKLDNSKDDLTFECESEKGMMVVFGKSKKKKIKEGKGAILITTYSTTGAQNYY